MVSTQRRLLDTATPTAAADALADITVVTTAAQLQAAMMTGAQDILLRAHVDLTDMALATNSNTSMVSTVLGDTKPSTRSIRVWPRPLSIRRYVLKFCLSNAEVSIRPRRLCVCCSLKRHAFLHRLANRRFRSGNSVATTCRHGDS